MAAAVLALVVAACGGSDDEASGGGAQSSEALRKGTTVRLWTMNNGPHPLEDTERIVRPFEQRTGVK